MYYARWATRDEVAKRLVPVNNETGVKKGGIPLMFDEKYLYIDQKEAHSLIIGCTGSGKTQVSILPTLKFAMLAGESFVINDPKGEIYMKMANKLKEEEYDVIISNPPFSQKDNVLKRLYELNKPYAMLLPVPTLQGQARFPYMKDIQYLGFDKRINYYKDIEMTKTQDGVSFGSCYLCRKFLPRDLIIEELKR